MDPSLGFAQLLGIAQSKQADKTVSSKNLLKTKFSANKKEKREKGKPSPNVQKFLEKKEAEERQKKIEAKLQKERLNELRSQKDKNKIAKMLKVTKSANYSVLADAVDNKNTAVTMTGRKQCDEDDYGFASSTSQNLYEKLMSKYEADPEDPMAKFSKAKEKKAIDIASAKERVKDALKREEANPMIPGKRRRTMNPSERADPGCRGGNGGPGGSRSKESGGSSSNTVDRAEAERERKKEEERRARSEKERKEEEARKKRIMNAKKAPPPIDFQSLLKMANQKKDEPVKVDKKKSLKDSEFGSRPMTEQEKKEFMRENESRLRREGKLPPKEKVPERKREITPDIDLRDSRKPARAEPGPSFHKAVKKSMPDKGPDLSGIEREKREMERKLKELEAKKEEMENRHKVNQYNEKKRLEFEKRKEEEKRREIERKREKRKEEEDKKEMSEMQRKYKEMQQQMKDMEARLKGGSSNGKVGGKRDPHSVEARVFPGEKRKPEKGGRRPDEYKRRIESDSEDEYDSEMDDFLDDSEANVDISKEIRSIFGYDKRKYHDEDFDDRSMENNKFSSIMMEEARSARIGRQEDLEDMRREEEEIKRKKAKMRR